MDIFHLITRVEEHQIIKPLILKAIEEYNYSSILLPEEVVSKSDWNAPKSTSKEYLKYFLPFIDTTLSRAYQKIGGIGVQLQNIWFHQYCANDRYDWHNHTGANFANIYYLEFPKGSPKTEFQNPFNRKEIITFDVKEGDVLTVPGFLIHRSPPVTSVDRKTIIAFNSDLATLV
jgi:hypothetical protein